MDLAGEVWAFMGAGIFSTTDCGIRKARQKGLREMKEGKAVKKTKVSVGAHSDLAGWCWLNEGDTPKTSNFVTAVLRRDEAKKLGFRAPKHGTKTVYVYSVLRVVRGKK